jgi:hypothetical protein
MIEEIDVSINGHVKIWDPYTKEVFVQQHNAVNQEVLSSLIANLLVSSDRRFIAEMHFGNGGIIVDETGNITYKDVEINLETGFAAGLFNPTYFKVVDTIDSEYNDDVTKNNAEVSHTQGLTYSDIIVTCTLDADQPNSSDVGNLTDFSQNATDTGNLAGSFVFNELGLKSKGLTGLNTGYLLSHIVFHPVEKAANRTIQIVYTLRIRIA